MLDGLTCDILFDEDFLDKTTAFETYRGAFSIIESDDAIAEVNGIVWFNTAESRLSRGIDALGLRPRSGTGAVPENISGKLRFFNSSDFITLCADCLQTNRKKALCTESRIGLVVYFVARWKWIILSL